MIIAEGGASMPEPIPTTVEEASRRVLAKLDAMTQEEAVQTLKDDGILDANGNIAPRYHGGLSEAEQKRLAALDGNGR
jgi:hypothetical protein